jgi:hypothetical protein
MGQELQFEADIDAKGLPKTPTPEALEAATGAQA